MPSSWPSRTNVSQAKHLRGVLPYPFGVVLTLQVYEPLPVLKGGRSARLGKLYIDLVRLHVAFGRTKAQGFGRCTRAVLVAVRHYLLGRCGLVARHLLKLACLPGGGSGAGSQASCPQQQHSTPCAEEQRNSTSHQDLNFSCGSGAEKAASFMCCILPPTLWTARVVMLSSW